MEFFTKLLNPLSGAPASERAASGARLVKYYDRDGRKRFAPTAEWRRRILPQQIASAGDEPRKLHRIVAAALEHGCAEAVLPLAARLIALDPDQRRSRLARARVLLAAGQADAAEKVCLDFLGGHGADAGVLTCLARVFAQRGDRARADEVLWQALRADPNHAEAVEWWGALHLDGMSRIADLPCAWRAPAALARCALANHQVERALEQYRTALERAGDDGDALRQVAEELVAHGQYRAVLDLVWPAYDPARHGPWTGLAILRACTECHEITGGRALLHALFLRHRHELRDHLQTYANRFLTLLDEPAPAPAAPVEVEPAPPAELRLVAIERPVWWGFLRHPEWLRPTRPVDAPMLVFAGFSHAGDDTARAWARALPLALAEAFAFRAEAEAIAVLPVVDGQGPADPIAPWSAEEAYGFATQGERFADYVVTGEVVHGDGHCRLRLTVHDAAHRTPVGAIERTGSASAIGAMLRTVEAELSTLLSLPLGDDPLGVYASPHPRALPDWLAALDQLARLHLAVHGHAPGLALLERIACLETCARLVEGEHATALHRLLFLAAVAGDESAGSQCYREHHDLALTLIEEDDDRRSPFRRAAPLLLWMFDQLRDFRVRRDELLAESVEPAYREWLERIGTDAAQFVVIADGL